MPERKQEINKDLLKIMSSIKETLREPILKLLTKNSVLTEVQLETLLVDLVLEDQFDSHVPYEIKAALRQKQSNLNRGVSRGAFNRTLRQARRNLTRCFYTMILLAYLGLFDYAIFRPFEEIAAKIGDYRRIRELLSGKTNLTEEEIESYRVTEETILQSINEIISPLILKSGKSKKKL